MKTFQLTEPHLGLKQEQIVYEFDQNTFGLVNTDERLLGEPCIAVSKKENQYPFVVVPISKLKECN